MSALVASREDLSWRDDALCAQVDSEMFFPDKGGSTRQAKKICASCNVAAECLAYALDRDERFGIWGGLSERERRKIKAAITCPHCGQTFVTGYGRDRHLAMRHDPAKPHVCPDCAQTFPYPAHLNRHIQTRHVDLEGIAS